ncbi:hypothetical protein, partial [Phytomonospora endophytica]|uniref:hypothetical protein n=1 Tax=Phytomonospora endophytica TaxID=714109 RepID=UPI001941822C
MGARTHLGDMRRGISDKGVSCGNDSFDTAESNGRSLCRASERLLSFGRREWGRKAGVALLAWRRDACLAAAMLAWRRR